MPATKVRRASRSSEVPFERRTFRSEDAAMADGRHFVGHAAVYAQRTAIGNPLTWGFYEEVARGAFDKTINDGADVVFDWDHDTRWVLARTSNGTLKLDPSDSVGLAVDADMAPVSYANDLRVLVDRGDVRGMSFQFQVVKDEWRTETVTTSDGQSADVEVRTILECRLIDVTATALPAYAGTDTDLRHAAKLARESRSIRTAGAVERRDADTDGDDDANVLAAAVDAAIDEAIDLLADVDVATLPTPVAQAVGLIRAADVAIDKLLAVLGVPDPDAGSDDGGDNERTRREPATATRGAGNSDTDEPTTVTRDAVADDRRERALRMQRLREAQVAQANTLPTREADENV